MESYYAEISGRGGAASLYAAHAKTIIPLRIAAVIANALAMAYSLSHGTYPTFVLNALLLPLNAWRLHQMISLIRDIDTAIASDMNVDWLLKYMRPKHYRAGDIMMERGEYATEAFYVVAGEVEIVEINQARGAGTLLGEIGLFTPNGRRTMTVRCKTDVRPPPSPTTRSRNCISRIRNSDSACCISLSRGCRAMRSWRHRLKAWGD